MNDQDINQTMLQAAQQGRSAEMTDPDAVDYDWTASNCFSDEQLARLNDLAAGTAETLSQVLTKQLRAELTFETEPATTCYADELSRQFEQEKSFYLSLVRQDGRAAGMIVLRAPEAADWVARFLGGKAGDEERDMSDLEISLLQEVIAVVAEAACGHLRESGGAQFAPKAELSQQPGELLDGGASQFCRFAFRRGEDAEEPVVSLLLLTDAAEEALGGEGQGDQAAAAGQGAGEQMQAHMNAHVMNAHVRVSTRLGAAMATIRDLAALEPGDVLVLDRRIDQPVELVGHGQTVATGLPVTCEGFYGLRIAQPPSAMAESTAPAGPRRM